MNLDFHELLDLTHDLPGWSYKWICACCLINAKAGILLEFQLRDIANHLFVDFDTDHTPWVRCRKCKHKFHLTCITCMTLAELLATGDFVCCSNWTKFIVICFHRIFHRRFSGGMCFYMCTVLCHCVCVCLFNLNWISLNWNFLLTLQQYVKQKFLFKSKWTGGNTNPANVAKKKWIKNELNRTADEQEQIEIRWWHKGDKLNL